MSRMAITITCAEDRERAVELVRTMGIGMRVEIKQAKRSQEQNDCLWPRLREISEQVEWYGQKLTEYDWKDVFTAALREARIVPGINGRSYVQLGLHTSDLSKEEMSNLLELIAAFAAERGVVFKDQADTNSSGDHGCLTDAPAGEDSQPRPSPAGAHIHEEASLLSDDWRRVYITALSGVRDKAASLLTRHTDALQMIGGKPSEMEVDWMRLVYRLVSRRNEGKLRPGQYDAEIRNLEERPLSDLLGESACMTREERAP